jgi:hypothetical protein
MNTYIEVDQFYADLEATKAAEQETTKMMLKHGHEGWACGFAWVYYPERIRKNSQMAKCLAAIGFRWNDYYKRMEKRNLYHGQSIDFAEAACGAYADCFTAITGLKMATASRID